MLLLLHITDMLDLMNEINRSTREDVLTQSKMVEVLSLAGHRCWPVNVLKEVE